jgi:digalactosyldiacylglycerol synthase
VGPIRFTVCCSARCCSAQIIKLSDAVQPLPRQATQYVHGAPGCFLEIGDEASQPAPDGGPRFSKGAYTLGKMVWGKVRVTQTLLLAEHTPVGPAPHS